MTDNQADAAAKKHADDTKKRLADEKTAREANAKTAEALAGSKPTPTQEENDLAASGVPVIEHEDDGSGAEPTPTTKQSEANKAPQQRGGYATRTVAPAAKHE
jgi:hypothetical protein